jgi:hypothetical protein
VISVVRPTHMQFGRLAGNDHINERIYDLLGRIHSSDIPTFVRKFRSESDEQCFHSYRELILGSHLCSQRWNLRYEQSVGGRKPDWAVLNDQDEIVEVVDVVTLHQRRVTDVAINKSVSRHVSWAGWITIPPDHLFSKVQQKANAYGGLVERIRLPYVVALFGEFTASIDVQEVRHVLHELHGGLFAESPTLAGVIFFREQFGKYEFSHFAKPNATYPSAVVRQG